MKKVAMNYSETPYSSQQTQYDTPQQTQYDTPQETTSHTPPNSMNEESYQEQQHQEEEYYEEDNAFNHFTWIIPLVLLLFLSAGYLFYHFKIKDRTASTTQVSDNQGSSQVESNSIAGSSDTEDSYLEEKTAELKETKDYYTSSPYESIEDETAANSKAEEEDVHGGMTYDEASNKDYSEDRAVSNTSPTSFASNDNTASATTSQNHSTSSIYSKYDLPKGYYAILNAFSEKRNALKYVRQISSRHGTPYIVQSGGTYKTSVYLSSTEGEAESKLSSIRQSVNQDAWMLRNN